MALAQGDDAHALLRPLDADLMGGLGYRVEVTQDGRAEVVPKLERRLEYARAMGNQSSEHKQGNSTGFLRRAGFV